MRLVEVYVVGLQAAQAVLNGAKDMLAGKPFLPGARPHLSPAFGRQDKILALALEPLADDLLRAPDRLRVDVGGINEVDARLRRLIHDGEAGRLVSLRAKGHGSQTDLRDFQPRPSHASDLHACLHRLMRGW